MPIESAGAKGIVEDALSAVMGGPQAKRATLTYERLRRLAVAGSELPDAWAAILVRGAGTPRSAGRNGREGVLSPLDAQNAALAHRVLSAEEREAIDALLRGARVEGQDLDGNPVSYGGSGLLARCLQHETDHCKGTVFGDRLNKRARKKLFKQAEEYADSFPPDWPVVSGEQ